METILEFKNVWKAYRPRQWVLRGISFTVSRREVVVIVGSNGSGKTTIARIAAGLLRPSKGVVRVCGFEPWSRAAKECRDIVAHWPFTYDELTVSENLALYATLKGVDSYSVDVDSYAEKLKVKGRASELAGWLSFGWRRRVEFVRAFLGKPKLLILDEPFTGLDKQAVEEIVELLLDYARRGGAILVTTPKGERELVDIATRVYLLSDGVLREYS